MYKKTILDNGLRIISNNMPKRQSVAVGIWLNVGGRYEDSAQKGISHFLEHLLFKGSKKYSCRKIKESIEGVGGALNGFTSEELTCYLVKIPNSYWGMSLDVLSDMVLNPALPQVEIEKEKGVILEEIKMYKDQPQSYVYELLDDLLWPNQPLGTPIIGSVESVSSIDRLKLKSFKDEFYNPLNITVSVAGSISHDKLIKAAQKIFSANKHWQKSDFLRVVEEQKKPQLKLFQKDTEQTHMALGFHALQRQHQLKHALGLLHVILGANMSSRLFNEIREKRGLAYEIGTYVKRYFDTGVFVVHAGIDNSKVSAAVELILKELKKAKDVLVTEGEFKRAKDFYLGQLMLALEDTLDHMLWIGESTSTIDKTYSISEVIKEVNAVTRSDLRKVACHIFQEQKMNLALIGPLKEPEQGLFQQLKID
ncbi:MAG: insulinase family protein [Candidatus Omnitrophica bacterium]|nr:insulinase family protein [Candidatus Omnitrophota bacterium]